MLCIVNSGLFLLLMMSTGKTKIVWPNGKEVPPDILSDLSALLLLCSVVLEKDTFFSRSFWYRLRAFAKPARTQLLSLEQSDGE